MTPLFEVVKLKHTPELVTEETQVEKYRVWLMNSYNQASKVLKNLNSNGVYWHIISWTELRQ